LVSYATCDVELCLGVAAERLVKAQDDGGFTAGFEGVVFSAFDGL
jgi:hypothetical protein